MFKELKNGLLMMTVMTVITGLVYPVLVTALAQVAFREQANGSLVTIDGHVAGSRLIGQTFMKPDYFHPRPSAAGLGYDPRASGGTNLGPTSAKLFNGTIKVDDKNEQVVDFDGIKDRIVHYCIENGIPFRSSRPLAEFRDAGGNLDDVALIKAFNDEKTPLVVVPAVALPADAVTSSASGLDPHISPRNAELQAVRVAKARGVSVEQVQAVVARHTQPRTFGFLGEPTVNVLELNLALDGEVTMKK